METYSPRVQSALSKLTDDQRSNFESVFNLKKKNKIIFVVLAIVFPIQLFLLKKVGLGILFWLTGGGLVVWWIIEIFLVSKRVDDFNDDLAVQIINENLAKDRAVGQ